jgi:hypothetical protein
MLHTRQGASGFLALDLELRNRPYSNRRFRTPSNDQSPSVYLCPSRACTPIRSETAIVDANGTWDKSLAIKATKVAFRLLALAR